MADRPIHYRSLYDSEYVAAWELNGRDCPATITKVDSAVLVGPGGKKNRKAILTLAGKRKRFAACVTDSTTISGMYGTDVRQWVGKRITLFPTTTKAKGGETVDCIRVRPRPPNAPDAPPDPAPPEEAPEGEPAGEREPGEEG